MNNDCVEVDDLILQLADYKDDYADVAAEKLLRKCSRSWEAYRYLDKNARRVASRQRTTTTTTGCKPNTDAHVSTA